MGKIIAQGAEAVLEKKGNIIIKNRIKKSYRIPEIDVPLRRKRTRTEAKLLVESRRVGVATPQVLSVSGEVIKMEYIDGIRLKEFFQQDNPPIKKLSYNIGSKIASLHKAGIIHGDLTTSNMILRDNDIIFIDFGLGFFSNRVEDMAQDMEVLKESINSTHFIHFKKIWDNTKKGYLEGWEGSKKVFKALKIIEARGRYIKRTPQ